jgi:hypothetical protein
MKPHRLCHEPHQGYKETKVTVINQSGGVMARKYSEAASKKVERAMHELKRGTLKSGRSGSKVKSRKQAIAIGLSEARRAGKKVPKRRSATKRRSG